jgi:hypothetical protein
VAVKFKPKTGAEQSQRATLVAGGDVRMEFTPASPDAAQAQLPPIETPPQPPPSRGEAPAWTVPAAVVAGGFALAGTGVFIGFGAKSTSIYNDLAAKCGTTGCGPEDRATADAGKRDQTIANVGLAVGIAGAASMITFLLIRAYAPRSASGTPQRLTVSLGALSGTF